MTGIFLCIILYALLNLQAQSDCARKGREDKDGFKFEE